MKKMRLYEISTRVKERPGDESNKRRGTSPLGGNGEIIMEEEKFMEKK